METTNDKGTYNQIHSDFEKAYISLRKSEGRLFSDYEVLQLPDVSEGHPYYKEWHIRKRSSKRLLRHLQSLNKPLSILEVGCGNGWLSALLSQLAGSTITGIDINLFELDQAKKLFAALNNVQFIEASIDDLEIRDHKYDIILFASSIQYFHSFHSIIQQSLQLLNQSGEIHIIDTHFYPAGELENARMRSLQYFSKTGHDKMSEYYYHHGLDELSQFNAKILEGPGSIFNKLSTIKNPFYWIRIKHG